MAHKRPIISTDRLADCFERLRVWIFVLMVVISIGAAYGYVQVPRVSEVAPETLASASQPPNAAAPPSAVAIEVAPSPATPHEAPPVAARPDPNIKTEARRQQDRSAMECILVVEVEDVFTPRTSAAVRDVVTAVRGLNQVRRVIWLDSIPVMNLFGVAKPLLPSSTSSLELFREAKIRAQQHPLVYGHLLSRDGKTLMIPIDLNWIQVTSDEDCVDAIVHAARSAAMQHSDVDMRIRLTGRVPLYLAVQDAIDHNHFKFQVIGYALVLLLAIVLFRGFSAVVIVAGAPALGIFWSIGWLTWFQQLDNPLTGVVLPVLISMVGFTDGVHLIVHIRAARAAGLSSMEAAKSAIRKVGLACALTSITTAVGFGSLMLSSNHYVQGFGRACAIGVLLTFVAVITFIPLVSTTWLGRNVQQGHEKDFVRNNLQRLAPLIDWVIGHRVFVATTGVLATLLLMYASKGLRPDDRLSDRQPTGSEAYEAMAHCDDVFGGIETVAIRVAFPEWLRPESVRVMEAIADAEQVLKAEPLVQSELSINDFLDQFPGARAPITRAAYLALLPEEIQESYLNRDAARAVITGRIQDLGIATYAPVFKRIEDTLGQLNQEEKYLGFHFHLAGDPVDRGRQLYLIVVDLVKSLGTATIVIFLVMTVVYRSLTVGIIAMIPNLFPLAVTATFLVVMGYPLEIASVCSFTVCLGIAVDDSIHFLTRYQDERRLGKDPSTAVRTTFISVGTALITTTVVLIVGFGTVLTSNSPGHRTFAAMACWTIGAALLADLIFLPALLLCFDSKAKQATKA